MLKLPSFSLPVDGPFIMLKHLLAPIELSGMYNAPVIVFFNADISMQHLMINNIFQEVTGDKFRIKYGINSYHVVLAGIAAECPSPC